MTENIKSILLDAYTG